MKLFFKTVFDDVMDIISQVSGVDVLAYIGLLFSLVALVKLELDFFIVASIYFVGAFVCHCIEGSSSDK